MRLTIELTLSEDKISKDKNKLFVYLIKEAIKEVDYEYFEEMYHKNKRKEFTFSTYLGKCKFMENYIQLDEQKIIINISTFSEIEGILFYNGFLKMKKSRRLIKIGEENSVLITKVSRCEEKLKLFNQDTKSLIFKTISPILIKEHNHNNKHSYYHNLDTQKGILKFIENQIRILKAKFPDDYENIEENFELDILKNKIIKIKYGEIILPANLAILKISTNFNLLKYMYLAGVGSKTNSGFGMLQVL